jgi:Protein of unknown function (DUF2591)
MKTSELTGAALDWAVAKCEGVDIKMTEENWDWYSTSSWEHGGPIIEEHGIHLEWSESHEQWLAYSWDRFSNANYHRAPGDTALVAAMRCYVASKIGDEVEIPKELL